MSTSILVGGPYSGMAFDRPPKEPRRRYRDVQPGHRFTDPDARFVDHIYELGRDGKYHYAGSDGDDE